MAGMELTRWLRTTRAGLAGSLALRFSRRNTSWPIRMG